MAKIKIEINVTEKTTADGRKFLASVGFKKNGEKINVSFTSDCPNKPTKAGKYTITVNPECINESYKKRYPVLWIKYVDKIEEGYSAMSDKRLNHLMETYFTEEENE